MEDNSSSNGIVAEQEYKEVAVEDVGDSKTDPGEGSILDKIVAVAEEVLHGDGSSSSSSSDDEGEQPEPKAAEDKVESSPAVDDVPSNVENFVSIVEAKLESVVSDHDEAKDSSASAVSPFSEVKIAEAEEVVSKVVEENACVVVSSEPPSENVDDVHIDQIPETAANPVAPGVCVTRDSLQAASWKSCCGLFEVLRRSER